MNICTSVSSLTMLKSKRKVSALSAHADKMVLCRACMVLLGPKDAAYDLYREKDLAAKFIGCVGASEDLHYLRAPLDKEINSRFVLMSICESCYQLVQKFHDFQRMCEESLKNFDKLISEINSEVMAHNYNEEEKSSRAIQIVPKKSTKELKESIVEVESTESIEDIEEVYIVEDETAKRSLGNERLAISSQRYTLKRPRGVRYKIECDICSRGFYKVSLFDEHVLKHQGYQPYKCRVDKCGKVYSRANLLTAHLRETHHNNIITYPCKEPNCNKVYTALRSLNYHVRRQHAEPPESSSADHMCEKCGKSFGRMAHLTRHQWVHRSKREFQFECNFCAKRFYTNDNLSDHFLRRHSNEKLYRCKRCGRIFGSRVGLSTHLKKHVKSPTK